MNPVPVIVGLVLLAFIGMVSAVVVNYLFIIYKGIRLLCEGWPIFWRRS